LTVAEKMSFWKNNKERKKKEKNGNILGKDEKYQKHVRSHLF